MVQFINSWIQKITYMWRKWGATQNFCLTSIYELEKQLLKKLLNWAYKKCKNFNIYMLKKKEKRKTTEDIINLHLCTYNLDDMICSSWDIKCDRLNLVITGHFLPFPPLITWKTRILKKLKKWLEISSFYTCVLKTMIIRSTVPEIQSETDRIFCHFGPFFALLPP